MESSAFNVRRIVHRGGRVSHWIFTSSGEIHRPSLDVLKQYTESSQQTYAYALLDHLKWLDANQLDESAVTLDDLLKYMKALTGTSEGVYGIAWRERPPLSLSAAANVASVVKAYYLSRVDSKSELLKSLSDESRPIRSHGRWVSGNPLAPRRGAGRPRFLPDEVVDALFEPKILTTSRDLMIVTWLRDSGIRVGGLCGLRFCDLHLMHSHPCRQRADPHVHIVGRDDNPNRARAKAYYESSVSTDGYVIDGVIRAVSDAMITSFYGYFLDEYCQVQHLADHGQVLVHVNGPRAGAALTTSGVRKMLRRACQRADLSSYITPHAFRHKAAAELYAASDFNAELVAQEFGWASAEQVTELYGRSANRSARRFLEDAWDRSTRPSAQQTPSLSHHESR